MEVGFWGSRYIGEDVWLGRNVQVGTVFLFGALKQATKKKDRGLRLLPGNILNTTTNQKIRNRGGGWTGEDV
jgi:hypothetical protein